MAQRLSRLHGINAPEFFDKGVFCILFNTLKTEGYLDEDGAAVLSKVEPLSQDIAHLLTPEIKLTIHAVMTKED